MRAAKAILMMAAVLGLGACQARDVVKDVPPRVFNDTLTGPADQIAATADWSQAKTVILRMRQSIFQPSLLTIDENRPYVLRLENADDIDHSFLAREFFSIIAAHSLTPPNQDTGTTIKPGARLISIAMPARSVRELRFVAVRDGVFEFEAGLPAIVSADSHFAPFSRGTYGVLGTIRVDCRPLDATPC